MAIMCDESLNSTHFAMMQVIYNISNALPYFIGTMLIDYVSYYPWCAIMAFYQIIFLAFTQKYFTQIDKADKSEFILEKKPFSQSNNQVQDCYQASNKSPIKSKRSSKSSSKKSSKKSSPLDIPNNNRSNAGTQLPKLIYILNLGKQIGNVFLPY